MKELVHNRGISIRTYDLGERCILIEGSLIDHRYRLRQDEAPEESKVVHDMLVRLKIRGPGMLIEEAEARMTHHPREECPVVLPSIRRLEGLRIATGFTKKVKDIIGNTKGCAHLTSLVLAMGPSAVQGYWVAYGLEREITLREEAVRNIINTCYIWREDGPIVKGLREALESQASSE
ncbi:MAG: DUF2889 domain-containing protein [Deltaproteobacteria bacterium]|nr:DUF2889 domain-containing protein [Deltaproteobacteria bacterium]MBW2208261.1 DUF2889 domain-containing protein [Deltaproteobacteria bacterium]